MSASAAVASNAESKIDALPAPLQRTLLALALGWTPRRRPWVADALRVLGGPAAAPNDDAFDEVLASWLRELQSRKLIVAQRYPQGAWLVEPAIAAAAYRRLLERADPARLRRAILRADETDSLGSSAYVDRVLAQVRLELYLGEPLSSLEPLRTRWSAYLPDWNGIVDDALFDTFDETLFARVDREVRVHALIRRLEMLHERYDIALRPCVRVARTLFDESLAADGASIEGLVRLGELLVEHAALDGATAEARRLLERVPASAGAAASRLLLEGTIAATASDWGAAESAYARAIRALHAQSGGRRKGAVPFVPAWLYVLSLMAQQTPQKLAAALAFCIEHLGKREYEQDVALGPLARAIEMRMGDRPTDLDALAIATLPDQSSPRDLWVCIGRAWLVGAGADRPLPERQAKAARNLLERLRACDLGWVAAQLDGALAVMAGEAPPARFWIPSEQDAWRAALAALAAIGATRGASATAGAQDAEASVRIVWTIELDDAGRVLSIAPGEQRRGARGWMKAKPLPLARLHQGDKLDAWDAKVVGAVKRLTRGDRGFVLDAAAAVIALIGHPAVELADAPGEFVELVPGRPSLEVVERDDAIELEVHPCTAGDDAPGREPPAYASEDERREAEALRLIRLVRESSHRVRVVQFTATQRRAAQIVGHGLRVPHSARDDVEQTLHVLASHFDVHAALEEGAASEARAGPRMRGAGERADHGETGGLASGASDARTVAAESGLRAELTPYGDGLALRLVVAPLGEHGPRLAPGTGRPRVIAMRDGAPVAASRDLGRERADLQSVLDACPMLACDDASELRTPEWRIESAEDALAMLETLGMLPAIADIDWPRGRTMQITPVDASALALQVRGARDWFAVKGGIRIDEERVLGLAQLLEWSREGRSRFLPLGDGKFLALAGELRARIDELARVADVRGGVARVPQIAAPWLQATLQSLSLDADAAFRERLERFEAALRKRPALPSALQATLRPYQVEGYAWAMRLAHAGLGACLADDMGLGKTLQALAVLLARGAGGPALVVAPTSLCGNWRDEARRYAPSLVVRIYGQDAAPRQQLLDEADRMHVVVVSYTLLQQAQQAFGAVAWHTLIADEAQAIKNAQARRSQALFEIDADFRMALSGTPVENRLAELWSIMRFCNPGLLGSLERFNERIAAPIERDRDRVAQRTLRHLIAPFVLRRTKTQVLDELPARSEQTMTVVPGEQELAYHETLRRSALESLLLESASASADDGDRRFHVLAQLTRLRRAACDPRLVDPEVVSRGAKVGMFAELVEELVANGHKALVFSQFVDFLTLLREPLDEAGIRYQYLDGSTPAAERSRRVAAFQAGEGDLFLISLKAGGFGLNLTAADYVIITDPWWNPAAEDQASGRAHRMGQQRPVTVYRLVTQGTIEERIVELHRDKRALADVVLEGAQGAVPPSVDELIRLMRDA